MCSKAKKVVKIDKLKKLNRVVLESYDKAINLAYKEVKKDSEVVVIESYSNIATPLPLDNTKSLKIVFGVEP